MQQCECDTLRRFPLGFSRMEGTRSGIFSRPMTLMRHRFRYSTHELAVLNSRARCSIMSITLLRHLGRSDFVSAARDFA